MNLFPTFIDDITYYLESFVRRDLRFGPFRSLLP